MGKLLDILRKKYASLSHGEKIVMGIILALIIFSGLVSYFLLAEIGVIVNVENAPVSVKQVKMLDSNFETISTIKPYTKYYVSVVVEDYNSIRDVKWVKFVMYSWMSSLNDTDKESDHYTFIYDAEQKTWYEGIENTILGGCSTPQDTTLVNGTYTLAFRLLLARASIAIDEYWYLTVIVYDGETTDSYTLVFNVDIYTEISLSVATITFTGSPGSTNVASNPTYVVVSLYANYYWELLIKGTDLKLGEYSISVDNLKVDDDPQPVEETETGQPIMSLSLEYEKCLGKSGDYVNGLEIKLYFFIDIPLGTPKGEYTGIIYLSINIIV